MPPTCLYLPWKILRVLDEDQESPKASTCQLYIHNRFCQHRKAFLPDHHTESNQRADSGSQSISPSVNSPCWMRSRRQRWRKGNIEIPRSKYTSAKGSRCFLTPSESRISLCKPQTLRKTELQNDLLFRAAWSLRYSFDCLFIVVNNKTDQSKTVPWQPGVTISLKPTVPR